jgi:lysophospholipase L1-like esterase
MKRKSGVYQALVLLSLGFLVISPMAAQTKVACIGDSITEGSGSTNSSMYGYPAQLQKALGTNYNVGNFGVGGRTLLKKGDYPYWNETKFTDSKNFLPKIVIIQLGTNDSKTQNWAYKSEFLSNYKELINVYKNLSSKPTVYAAIPPVVYGAGAYGITNNVILYEIDPLIIQAASETGIATIDNYTATLNMAQNFPDLVHPNDTGYFALAFNVYKALGAPGIRASVYADANYLGSGVSLPYGVFNGGMMLAAGIQNDWMSSLKVAAGYTVEIYENGDFTGVKWTFTADTFYVGSDCNDKMSALKVIPPGPSFYADLNYGGLGVTVEAGNYSGSQMLAAGIQNDWMTSLKVPAGYTVTVYENGDFSGASWTFTADSNWVGTACNDKMSSMKITAPVAGPTFYADINYSGKAVTLAKGNYTLSQMTAAGIPDNWMSSLKVPAGTTVEVYDNGDFTGTMWKFTADSSWVGSTVNDKMSSIKIY